MGKQVEIITICFDSLRKLMIKTSFHILRQNSGGLLSFKGIRKKRCTVFTKQGELT
jgi:hypothetical protein